MKPPVIDDGGPWVPGDSFSALVEHLKVEHRTRNVLTVSHWHRELEDPS